MSSRRTTSRSSSTITVDDINDHHQQQHQINDLLFKLQTLVPELHRRRRHPSSSNRTSAFKTLKETCNYIRSLHKEVDDLSERLSEVMASMDTTTLEQEILRSLLFSQN